MVFDHSNGDKKKAGISGMLAMKVTLGFN